MNRTLKVERREDAAASDEMAREISEKTKVRTTEDESRQPGAQSPRPVDAESRRGRFEWCEFQKEHIPYIFRTVKGEKASARIFPGRLTLIKELPFQR